GTKPQRRVPLDLIVHAAIGQRLRITGQAANGASCNLESTELLATANKHPLTQQVLEQQLRRLGATVYELRTLRADIVGQPMAPLSVLGKLRHQMIEQLATSSGSRPNRQIRQAPQEPPAEPGADSVIGSPKLRVLCRTL